MLRYVTHHPRSLILQVLQDCCKLLKRLGWGQSRFVGTGKEKRHTTGEKRQREGREGRVIILNGEDESTGELIQEEYVWHNEARVKVFCFCSCTTQKVFKSHDTAE